jgi:hypothetical protein
MMQMLAAGGLPVMTDGRRSADSDNPEGYYEWEAIKQVGAHPEILQEAAGKAIKVISMLLPALPAGCSGFELTSGALSFSEWLPCRRRAASRRRRTEPSSCDRSGLQRPRGPAIL